MQLLPHCRAGHKGGALVWLILSVATTGFAQNLGDVARQERQRKQQQAPVATHVYTNEDLKKLHILVPEDQERVLAARRNGTTPPVLVAARAPVSIPVPSLDLPDLVFPALPVPAPVAPDMASVVDAPAAPAPVSAPVVTPAAQPVAVRVASPAREPVLSAARTRVAVAEHVTKKASPKLASVAAPAVSHKVTADEGAKGGMPARVTSVPVGHSNSSKPQLPRVVSQPATTNLSSDGVITVERGDSLWKLAKRYLGKGARWRELAVLNTQISNADVIHVGEWVRLPGAGAQAPAQVTARHANGEEKHPQTTAVTASTTPATVAQLSSRQRFEP